MVVVAAAGYGKSTALRDKLAGAAVRWLAPADLSALVDGGLGELARQQGAGWLVLEDLPPLPADLAGALLTAATTLPAGVGLALTSRWPMDAPTARWSANGQLTVLGPRELVLSAAQATRLLADEYGVDDPALSTQVFQATAGWPALVRLAGESLNRAAAHRAHTPGGTLTDVIAGPETPLAAYVLEEVLRPLPPEVARLARDAAGFAPLNAGLCEQLGHPAAEQMLTLLARIGVLRPDRTAIVPVVAAVARAGSAPCRARARAAAIWYQRNGPPLAAAQAFHLAGDDAACAGELVAHGPDMLSAGAAAAVAELIRALPPAGHRPALRMLLGEALVHCGDLRGAVVAYEALAGEVDARGEPWTPGLAWRLGQAYYLLVEPRKALAALARSTVGGSEADEALRSAWTASTYLRLGDVAAGLSHAARARALATAAGDTRALATAHVATALCRLRAGDPTGCDEHFAQALHCARQRGDAGLAARVLANQAHTLLAQARYPAALDTARQAVRSAEAAGNAGALVLAQLNEAEALARLGRHDESADRYEFLVARYRRMGSRSVALALVGLAEVHRVRGARQQALACYEEAQRTAQAEGGWQALIPALAGLARVLADDDPAAAADYAAEAVRRAPAAMTIQASLAQGWVAVARGDLAVATACADTAARTARTRWERALLAETLELRAASAPGVAARREALVEAYEIWRAGRATGDADRVLLAIGRLPDASTVDRLHATLAAERMSRSRAGAFLPPVSSVAPVAIRVLGRFEVYLDGRAIPSAAWQSRKARDLLRVLVARGGRPVPRTELAELLWPDDEPDRTGHRLSVLLSIVRTVVNPRRAAPGDQIIVSDQACVALDRRRLRVDVYDFLADVAHAIRLREQGAAAEAHLILATAVRSYVGDPFEDEPYAEWCGPLREEARAAYLRAVRALARWSRDAGETEQAIGYLLRLLDLDTYDEPAHRELVETLVADGRHGEARRAYHRYAAAMRDIAVPEPHPGLLLPAAHPMIKASLKSL
ncbi:BTAD domain-containing putative transcriptional regulator [Actinomycetes bacterium KLBMP 9797]